MTQGKYQCLMKSSKPSRRICPQGCLLAKAKFHLRQAQLPRQRHRKGIALGIAQAGCVPPMQNALACAWGLMPIFSKTKKKGKSRGLRLKKLKRSRLSRHQAGAMADLS